MREGDVIDGKYRITKPMGEGGMGAVYEAVHTRINRRLAVKLLHSDLADKAELVTRFMREAQAATAIGSEHIVEIIDMGETPDGAPYIVMEHLEGETVGDAVRKQGFLQPARAARIMVQVCKALAAAHGQGIIHRDLKPENLFLITRENGEEWVKVLDFGIAKIRTDLGDGQLTLTATGTTLGTPFYMAPEQAQGLKDIDHRVDVYAAGVILYELLSGRPPFHATNYNELIVKIATREAPPLRSVRSDVSPELEAVVAKAMAKDPTQRYQAMSELAEALAPFATAQTQAVMPATAVVATPSGPIPAATGTPLAWQSTPPTAATGPERPKGRMALVVAGLAALVVLVVVGGFAATLILRAMPGDPSPAPAPAPVPAPTPAAPGPETSAPAPAPEAPTPTPTPSEASTVELRVSATPAEASIRVDGIAVEGNPFVASFPRDGARHRVEAEAEGHEGSAQWVVFDEDRVVEISLEERRRAAGSRPRPAPAPAPPTGSSQPAKASGPRPETTNPFRTKTREGLRPAENPFQR